MKCCKDAACDNDRGSLAAGLCPIAGLPLPKSGKPKKESRVRNQQSEIRSRKKSVTKSGRIRRGQKKLPQRHKGTEKIIEISWFSQSFSFFSVTLWLGG